MQGHAWFYQPGFFAPDFVAGSYFISATAYDQAGNSTQNEVPSGASALSFDGVDDYVALAHVNGLNPGNSPHTIEAWLRVVSPAPLSPWILQLGNPSDGSHYWLVKSDGKIRLGTWGGGEPDISPTLNKWNHIASVFDGTNLKVYVNGSLTASTPTKYNLQGLPFTVGKAYLGNSFLNGALGELRIWNLARTETEIRQGMTKRLSGREDGLICYWRCDAGKGAILNDASGHDNNGILVNGPTWTLPNSIAVIVDKVQSPGSQQESKSLASKLLAVPEFVALRSDTLCLIH